LPEHSARGLAGWAGAGRRDCHPHGQRGHSVEAGAGPDSNGDLRHNASGAAFSRLGARGRRRLLCRHDARLRCARGFGDSLLHGLCAGPIVHRISPRGLLCVCAGLAAVGLVSLSAATTGVVVFLAATLYGVGKTFFWPTTLGVVSEQFPRGGALTLNAMGGMGMIAVGVLGGPFLGAIL